MKILHVHWLASILSTRGHQEPISLNATTEKCIVDFISHCLSTFRWKCLYLLFINIFNFYWLISPISPIASYSMKYFDNILKSGSIFFFAKIYYYWSSFIRWSFLSNITAIVIMQNLNIAGLCRFALHLMQFCLDCKNFAFIYIENMISKFYFATQY